MSFSQAIKAHYSNKNRPLNARQIALPGIATGIGATVTAGNNPALGVWIDVALPAAVTEDTLITGIQLDTPSAGCILSIDIGLTWALGVLYANAAAVIAAGAASIADAHRAWIRVEIASDVGVVEPIMLPFPIWVPDNSGIIARGYTVGGGETVNVSVICLQLFEGG